MSANVNLLNATHTVTGANIFTSSVTIGNQSSKVWPFSRVIVYSTPGSNTWTVPSGVGMFKVTCIGGGGGGGAHPYYGGGGGGGGASIKWVYNVSAGSAIAYTVGAGGTAGNTGGTTSFGSYCNATGGTSNSVLGGVGGMGTLGDLNFAGQVGLHGKTIPGCGDFHGQGGGSYMGGGGDANAVGRAYGGGGGGGPTGKAGADGVVIIEY